MTRRACEPSFKACWLQRSNTMGFEPLTVKVHFDKLSQRWEDLYKPGALQAPRTYEFTNALTTKLPSPANVLDFGCGTGDISAAIAAVGYMVTGVDISPAMINRATPRSCGNLRFQVVESANPFQLPFGDSVFDGVVVSSVLEYLNPLEVYLRELRRVIRPGGVLLCTVPNMTHRSRSIEQVFRPLAKLFNRLPAFKGSDWFEYLELSVHRYPLSQWEDLLD